MKSKLLATLVASAVLAGCATVEPEYRMIPTGDHNVGVRFSRGNAAMVSNGPAGAVMLLPVRYNATSKMYFALAAFNTSGQPINFGTEDVRISLEDGTPLYVQDFNYLRHQERVKAQRDLNAAWIDAGVEGYLAYLDTKGLPDRTRRQIAFRTASGSYAVDSATIESRLRHAMSAWGRNVLQTTTIDSGATFGGYIFADQLLIPEGTGARSSSRSTSPARHIVSRCILSRLERTFPSPPAFRRCPVRPSSPCSGRQRRGIGPMVPHRPEPTVCR
ncbi:hypothetical protein [Brevundimonas sp. EYE_349]|uniref:hypothetical protein n=1 Tax=Brevundimonas sp. EYE_349 TaxID=2853455 RepID=UPI0020057BBB|nr:hypothetical protein [Brevundimonas sp. EYE_349]MCK6103928.1 hypothetical protein [Brevundimonas sp. EYE_349]